jgi:prevent-host-death family protein
MSRQITQRELRNDSAAVLREVQAGQTLVITRNGTPVAEIRPLATTRRFVPRAVLGAAGAGPGRIDAGRLREDLDAVADPRVEPR